MNFNFFFFIVELGNVESLRNKFKKREIPRSGRYADRQRLKISSVENNAQMSGYLRKKQKNGAKWKRFHFVLKDRVLYAYKAAEDAMPFDTFPILGFTLETLSEVSLKSNLNFHPKIILTNFSNFLPFFIPFF